jgi:membrane-associated protease RseP (regulator of RpoE activity)
MMAIGVLAFVVALLVSVMLHEAGHFATAKLFGMKATQFFVGFGPTLWSRQKGETEYGVKAIPAGGFVKIIGMTPLEDVAPEDESRAFIKQGGWQRFVVLVAGSTMHFVIALVLLFVLLIGWPSLVHGPAAVDSVQNCVTNSTAGDCGKGAPPAPAKGRLQKDDVIVAVNGQQVTKGGEQAASLIRDASASGAVDFTVERAGKTQHVLVNPVQVDGQNRVGITITDAPSATAQRVGFAGAVTGSFTSFGQYFVASFKALGAVPHEVSSVLSGSKQARTIDSSGGGGSQVTSVVGVAQISGEAFKAGGFYGGVATLIGITASVNLFVGIFNLFPLLPLDGGHVAILGYEKLRDRWRRRRKLSVAGPVDLAKLMPITYGALAIIVGVAVVVLYADIANPVVNPF